jgi:uncharacterized protein (DUF4415 family)
MSKRDKDNLPWSDEELNDAEFVKAGDFNKWLESKISIPKNKQTVTLRLDKDIINYFKKGGKGYQTKINAVLKSFINSNPLSDINNNS